MAPVPPAPAPEALSSILSLRLLGPRAATPSSRDQVSAGQRARLCAGSTRGHLGLQLPFAPLGQADSILTDSHYQMCELLFLVQYPWAREPGVGPVGGLPLQGGPCHQRPSQRSPSLWALGQCASCLHPSYQSRHGLFFNSLVQWFCSASVQMNPAVECSMSYL